MNVGEQELTSAEEVLVLSLWKVPAELNTLCMNQPLDFNRNYMLVVEFYGTNKTIIEKKSFF